MHTESQGLFCSAQKWNHYYFQDDFNWKEICSKPPES